MSIHARSHESATEEALYKDFKTLQNRLVTLTKKTMQRAIYTIFKRQTWQKTKSREAAFF
jgi:hypothetical protein